MFSDVPTRRIGVGDPMPWFSATTLAGKPFAARLASNAHLAEGETRCTGERDRLFPGPDPTLVPGRPGQPGGEPAQIDLFPSRV